ncbi:type I-C CRISPR-associated protein Cas8c/Csd1 [Thiothrix nivea]|uniref:CRISPR-associated protein, Csd1 family n=1 Tax=Thiothrix nivea (strain ATCC 35100 / DSM 5205 / JP2) TaxID=870187 RepID=A0A656HBM8_THINJ|nr:type I-C CRISPR-associated protein Cas8c/Csd1 [Thiothrix nivea]EIJ33767.1 CRISPR-associated protein, Csd1 family [Thiothrix nivea DSM 5205]
MILQALYDYYQRKSASPDSALAPAGFEYKEIPFILEISADGKLVQIEDTRTGDGKKKRAKSERVPQGVKKTSGVAANLLWDNAEYVLGVDTKGKPERVKEQQAAFAERIRQLNIADQDEGIAAVLAFLGNPDAEVLQRQPQWEEIAATNPNLTFRLQGQPHLVCQSRQVQTALMNTVSDEGAKATCLLTGDQAEIERLHPSIKGVWGAQTAGANIISFNLDAFTSYGKSQSFNAPVSKEAAFAYTTALNHLLGKDSTQRMQVGDASTVFWAEKEHPLEDDFTALWGAADNNKDDPDRNTNAVKALYKAVEEYGRTPALGEETRFFILGLAPNAARISIRFWHTGTVREVSQRIVEHFELLRIERSERDAEFLPLWLLLRSIALLGKSENVPPNLAGEVIRCILEGLPYPQTLLASAVRRIRAEQEVTYPRAALIKAYLNRLNPTEKLAVSLDLANMNVGYRLGRLFAVLEKIQEEAQPGINATIRDRYYGAASATPVTVFSTLMKLKNHHLSKMDNKGRVNNLEKLLGEIMAGIADFPAHLSLPDQGRFAIGYYHQRQDFFKKREKATETETTQTEIETGAQGELL